VKEKHDELVEEINGENAKCQERMYQAHMQKTSVRGDKGVGVRGFKSENILKPIHHPPTGGRDGKDMNTVFKDWQMTNASG
jgi:hypothetical protein